jgi:hypothetical protein
MIDKLLELVGLKELEETSRKWRSKQLDLEIEQAQQEVAELGAYIGKLIKEKERLKHEALIEEMHPGSPCPF